MAIRSGDGDGVGGFFNSENSYNTNRIEELTQRIERLENRQRKLDKIIMKLVTKK